MAFKPYNTADGHIPPWEYLPCSTITPKLGMALTLSSGQLVIATGTTKPQYISAVNRTSACSSGEIIPVIPLTPDLVLETSLSADGTALNIGDSVTLHGSDGLRVTATTTNGIFKITGFPEGTKGSGSLVWGKF